MGRLVRFARCALAVALSTVGVARAQAPRPLPNAVPQPESSDRVLPINLATALQLANARPLDVQIAARQVTIAARQLDRAKLAWVPNIVTGLDYFRHDGAQQNFTGDVVGSSRGALGLGVGPNVVFNLSDAIHGPLVAKQDLRARMAARQATANDAVFAVAESYFTVQQARGELAGATVALQKAEEVSRKAEKLAEGLAPPLEASRAKVELARRQQAATTARERWRIASAELVRLLRLEPGTLVEPMEPPFLPVTVIDATATVDALIPIGLTNRPELAGQQAVVQAALARLKQEKMRPLVPSIALRSVSTNPSGSVGLGGFAGGANDKIGGLGGRFDMDLQVMWEFQSLGFGNKARVGERRAEQQAAILELFRTQDRVASEVSTAYAQVKAAAERMTQSEPALKEATDLIEKSLLGMGQTRRVGEFNTLVVRPQEVVAAVQAFGQANADYYAAIGDFNRAQFRLYRALGHPGHSLAGAVAPPAAPVAAPPAIPVPAVQPLPPRELPPHRTQLPADPFVPLPPPIQLTGAWDLPITRHILTTRPALQTVAHSEPAKAETGTQWQALTPTAAPPPPAAPQLLPLPAGVPATPAPPKPDNLEWKALDPMQPAKPKQWLPW